MSKIWALADLHLSFGVKDKSMEFFGPQWSDWTKRIEKNWIELIQDEDLVLIPGDISWAMKVEEAVLDLEWIHALPGQKVIIRGNHDYWWSSLAKVEKILPSSIHLIQNNAFDWKDVSIAGARLWDSSEYQFGEYIQYVDNPRSKKLSSVDDNEKENERLFNRELERLETSLKCLNKNAKYKICMTHYPPISGNLDSSRTSELLEKYGVSVSVFGHLHNVKQDVLLFGEKNHIRYYLTSCDYLNFKPIRIDIPETI